MKYSLRIGVHAVSNSSEKIKETVQLLFYPSSLCLSWLCSILPCTEDHSLNQGGNIPLLRTTGYKYF
jgi:hypothetical protein